MRRRILILTSLLVVGGLATYFLLSAHGTARADDASRTTTLSITTYDFGTGDGAEAAIVATLVSTSSSDVLGTIYINRKPSGSSTYTPVSLVRSPTDGSQTGVDMDAAVTSGNFASGDTVQALFFCYDSSSNQTFSFSRTVNIP